MGHLPVLAHLLISLALPLSCANRQLYNESVHDLYQKGAAVQANLPVYEDEMEGYQVGARVGGMVVEVGWC